MLTTFQRNKVWRTQVNHAPTFLVNRCASKTLFHHGSDFPPKIKMACDATGPKGGSNKVRSFRNRYGPARSSGEAVHALSAEEAVQLKLWSCGCSRVTAAAVTVGPGLGSGWSRQESDSGYTAYVRR